MAATMALSYGWLLLFIVIQLIQSGSAIGLQCTIRKNLQGSTYHMNQEALSGITYDSGQTMKNFEALECYCSSQSTPVTLDTTVAPWLDTLGLSNWRNVSVFRVYNCKTLSLNLGLGNSNDLAPNLEGSAFIFDQIGLMTVLSLQAAGPASGQYYDMGTFTSLYFRNVTFVDLPNPLSFQQKAEVLFSGVTVTNDASRGTASTPLLGIKVTNTAPGMPSMLRVLNSLFPSPSDPTQDNWSFSASFVLTVTNSQYVYSQSSTNGQGCYLDYLGGIEIVGNSFGSFPAGTVTVTGAQSLTFLNNEVTSVSSGAFTLNNVLSLNIAGNSFAFAWSQPIVQAVYQATTSANTCKQNGLSQQHEDAPESSVQILAFSCNTLPSLTASPIVIAKDNSYDAGFLENSLQTIGNIGMTPCSCSNNVNNNNQTVTPVYINGNQVTSSDLVTMNNKVTSTSQCTALNNGDVIVGDIDAICRGDLRQTKGHMCNDGHEKARVMWEAMVGFGVFVAWFMN